MQKFLILALLLIGFPVASHGAEQQKDFSHLTRPTEQEIKTLPPTTLDQFADTVEIIEKEYPNVDIESPAFSRLVFDRLKQGKAGKNLNK